MTGNMKSFISENYDEVKRVMDVTLHRVLGARADAYLLTEDDYRDIIEEALLRMQKYSQAFDKSQSKNPISWGVSIAINVGKDMLEARSAKGNFVSIGETVEEEDGSICYRYDATSDDCTSDLAEHNDLVELLWDYAELHANSLQKKLLKFFLDGYKSADIAMVLGIPSKRITEEKSRFIRAAKAYFHGYVAA